MFQGGIVMVYQLNGKLSNNIKKIKKIRMKYQLLNLEKNVDHLQKNGLKSIKVNLNDYVLLAIGKIITLQ